MLLLVLITLPILITHSIAVSCTFSLIQRDSKKYPDTTKDTGSITKIMPILIHITNQTVIIFMVIYLYFDQYYILSSITCILFILYRLICGYISFKNAPSTNIKLLLLNIFYYDIYQGLYFNCIFNINYRQNRLIFLECAILCPIQCIISLLYIIISNQYDLYWLYIIGIIIPFIEMIYYSITGYQGGILYIMDIINQILITVTLLITTGIWMFIVLLVFRLIGICCHRNHNSNAIFSLVSIYYYPFDGLNIEYRSDSKILVYYYSLQLFAVTVTTLYILLLSNDILHYYICLIFTIITWILLIIPIPLIKYSDTVFKKKYLIRNDEYPNCHPNNDGFNEVNNYLERDMYYRTGTIFQQYINYDINQQCKLHEKKNKKRCTMLIIGDSCGIYQKCLKEKTNNELEDKYIATIIVNGYVNTVNDVIPMDIRQLILLYFPLNGSFLCHSKHGNGIQILDFNDNNKLIHYHNELNEHCKTILYQFNQIDEIFFCVDLSKYWNVEAFSESFGFFKRWTVSRYLRNAHKYILYLNENEFINQMKIHPLITGDPNYFFEKNSNPKLIRKFIHEKYNSQCDNLDSQWEAIYVRQNDIWLFLSTKHENNWLQSRKKKLSTVTILG